MPWGQAAPPLGLPATPHAASPEKVQEGGRDKGNRRHEESKKCPRERGAQARDAKSQPSPEEAAKGAAGRKPEAQGQELGAGAEGGLHRLGWKLSESAAEEQGGAGEGAGREMPACEWYKGPMEGRGGRAGAWKGRGKCPGEVREKELFALTF